MTRARSHAWPGGSARTGQPQGADLGRGREIAHVQQDALPCSCQTRVYLLPSLGSDAALWGLWGLWSWVHALFGLSSCRERWRITAGAVLACRRRGDAGTHLAW